jgi:uncharacterized phage-associated protein
LHDIIQVNEIEEFLNKYNIGQKPLAKLLGWGETTITRYLQGLTPSREYSDRLRELLNDPVKMRELYEKNKGRISDVACKKLELCLNEILEPASFVASDKNASNTLNVSKFFITKIYPEAGEVITHLKLQKMVYYVQSWYLAFFQSPFFHEDCEAWVHGPVFPGLYDIYKDFGNKPITKLTRFNENIFNNDQKFILNMVWQVYGKYDAKYLEKLTHIEYPWKKVRESYKKDERSSEVIVKEDIKDYYTHIKIKHNINSIEDLNKYVSNITILD